MRTARGGRRVTRSTSLPRVCVVPTVSLGAYSTAILGGAPAPGRMPHTRLLSGATETFPVGLTL